ncbi:MAG: hypothetical protein Q9M50_13850 [Methylococcales bacterium]|nr:hypothetical protein [Methylococcales bacterium]
MSEFKEYFFAKKPKSLSLAHPSIQSSITAISGSIVGGLSFINSLGGQSLPEKGKEKFANEVSSLAHSEGFIEEFSSIIKEPKKGETEDEFVNRAKKSMRKLLSEKLG